MSALATYVLDHTIRGACRCGRCIDAPADPAAAQPTGHTADVHFFLVAATPGASSNSAVLHALIAAHESIVPCDPLDGDEHSFIELGAWLGDQGVALQLMGLGALLGLWMLMTPMTALGPSIDAATRDRFASAGYVTIKAAGKEAHATEPA